MIIFRCYEPSPLFGKDYTKLRDFLIRLDSHNYHYGRWDWMITHGWLDEESLPKIGLWEDEGILVAVATYDCVLGKAYILTLPGYETLKEEMLIYSEEALQKDRDCLILISDTDIFFGDIALKKGYIPTTDKQCDAVIFTYRANLTYSLPKGFSITSMNDTFDIHKYGQVLWKGFNHEINGEGEYKSDDTRNGLVGFERPNVNLSLKIAVVAENGDFVSYCGMWYDLSSEAALVEPVATDPTYRKQGLGRAAVLEGVRRCKELGAKRAYVGSSQQFYYSIGFRPYATSSWWKKNK